MEHKEVDSEIQITVDRGETQAENPEPSKSASLNSEDSWDKRRNSNANERIWKTSTSQVKNGRVIANKETKSDNEGEQKENQETHIDEFQQNIMIMILG